MYISKESRRATARKATRQDAPPTSWAFSWKLRGRSPAYKTSLKRRRAKLERSLAKKAISDLLKGDEDAPVSISVILDVNRVI